MSDKTVADTTFSLHSFAFGSHGYNNAHFMGQHSMKSTKNTEADWLSNTELYMVVGNYSSFMAPLEYSVKKNSEQLKKPKGYISAFNFFAVRARHYLSNDLKNLSNNEINKYIGKLWKKIPDSDRAVFNKLADDDKLRYLKEVHCYNAACGGNIIPTINPPTGYGFDGEPIPNKQSQKIKRPRSHQSLFNHQALLECTAGLIQLGNAATDDFILAPAESENSDAGTLDSKKQKYADV